MKKTVFLAMIALQSFMAANAGAAPPSQLKGLDAYVHKAMKQWQVPGLAVAVVKDGKLVLAKGYGVRELGKSAKVNADTLFTIGSISKQFTAAALGTLVSAKKLDWNTPVVDDIKHFKLASPYVTQNITLRDLLSHRSGYCDPELMWYASDDTVENVIYRLRYQKPDYGFRAHFCYNNTMYLVASQFIPAITGETWNDYVAGHFFKPLRMARTDTTEKAVEGASNVAIPHAKVNGKVEVIKRYWANNMDVFAPVGGINSSVNDMSHWLEMLLANGKYDGKTILEPSVIRAMETPEIPIPSHTWIGDWLRTQTPDSHFYSYGFGFMLQDYGKYKVVWHAGDINGMASAMALVPSEHLGVVAFTNMDQSRAAEGVVFDVLQSYLGLPRRDVSKALYAFKKKEAAKAKKAENKLAATCKTGARPPLALSAYAGNYADDFYGTAKVTLEKGRLVLRLGNPRFTGDLQPCHDNTFRVVWRYRFYGKTYVMFEPNAFGKVIKLSSALGQAPHYERSEKTSH